MRKINYLLRHYIFILAIPALLSCKKVQRSTVNRDLAYVKLDAKNIRSELGYYFVKNGIFPTSLNAIGFNCSSRLKSGAIYFWTYAISDQGTNCQLVTRDKIEGNYVYINVKGETATSKVMPELYQMTWGTQSN